MKFRVAPKISNIVRITGLLVSKAGYFCDSSSLLEMRESLYSFIFIFGLMFISDSLELVIGIKELYYV